MKRKVDRKILHEKDSYAIKVKRYWEMEDIFDSDSEPDEKEYKKKKNEHRRCMICCLCMCILFLILFILAIVLPLLFTGTLDIYTNTFMENEKEAPRTTAESLEIRIDWNRTEYIDWYEGFSKG